MLGWDRWGSVQPQIIGPPPRMQNVVKLLDHLLEFFSRMELSSIFGSTANSWPTVPNAKCCEVARIPTFVYARLTGQWWLVGIR